MASRFNIDTTNLGTHSANNIGKALYCSQTVYGRMLVDRVYSKLGTLADGSNLYSTSGTCITPKAQPSKVYQWTSYGKIDVDDGELCQIQGNNHYKGTVTYEVQYSTDGGTNWGTNSPDYDDTNYETLSDANLQAVVCDADGNDAVRVRLSLSAHAQFLALTPIARRVWINYDNGTRYPFEHMVQ